MLSFIKPYSGTKQIKQAFNSLMKSAEPAIHLKKPMRQIPMKSSLIAAPPIEPHSVDYCALFNPSYHTIMEHIESEPTLPEFNDSLYMEQREKTQKEWLQHPLLSCFDGEILPAETPKLPTYSSLTRQENGSMHPLSDNQFEKIYDYYKTAHREPLTYNPTKISDSNAIIDDHNAELLSIDTWTKRLVEAGLDFEAPKFTESWERVLTQLKIRRFSQESTNGLKEGVYSYNVMKSGVLVLPVVNFPKVLDCQQKIENMLRKGIPVTVLVRQSDETASQYTIREIQELQQRFIAKGYPKSLTILVVTPDQRDRLLNLGCPTFATGKQSSMIAIQKKSRDAGTSGSGSSANIRLSKMDADFARQVREDKDVAFGRQCTAGNGASIPEDLDGFIDAFITARNEKTDIQKAIFEAEKTQDHVLSISQPPPKLPQQHRVVGSYAFTRTHDRFPSEAYTWGQGGFGVHVNNGRKESVFKLAEANNWLSMGYPLPKDIQKPELIEEMTLFCEIFNRTNATVATFGVGASHVFSAPQNKYEVFAEGTAYTPTSNENIALGYPSNTQLMHSNRLSDVPRGPRGVGFNSEFLKDMSQYAEASHLQAQQTFHLSKDDLGALVLFDRYIQSLQPKGGSRPNRGPSVEGWLLPREQSITRFLPKKCPLTQQPIGALDILYAIWTAQYTNVTIDKFYIQNETIAHYVSDFTKTNEWYLITVTDEEPVPQTRVSIPIYSSKTNDVHPLPDEILSRQGVRPGHIKGFGLHEALHTQFIDKISENIRWLASK